MPEKVKSGADETRRKKRFGFDVPLPAWFASVAVDLVDISTTGAQLRHLEAYPIGKEATLTVPVPGTEATLNIRARVRWSRLSGRNAEGHAFYHSGLLLTEQRPDIAADLVDQLVHTKHAHFDAASLEKKREAERRRAESRQRVRGESWQSAMTAAEKLDQVRKARIFLRNNPIESERWHNRARLIANRQRETSYSLELLAVWEYLGRNIEIDVVDLGFKLG